MNINSQDRPSRFQESVFISLVQPITENFVDVHVHNIDSQALVDTGATISCVSEEFVRKLNIDIEDYERATIPAIRGVGGHLLPCLGKISFPILIDDHTFSYSFHVFRGIHNPIILGIDFLKKYKVSIDLEFNEISIKDGTKQVNVLFADPKSSVSLLRTKSKIDIPPNSEMVIPVTSNSKDVYHGTKLIEPLNNLPSVMFITVARCVVTPEGKKSMCRIINPTDSYITVPGKKPIAKMTRVNPKHISQIDDKGVDVAVANSMSTNCDRSTSEILVNKGLKLGIDLSNADLTESQKIELLKLIGSHEQTFCTSMKDLGKTDVHEHNIETFDNVLPQKQRFYRASYEVKKEIEKQVDELLQNDLIEPSTSPWASPVVMVKKPSGAYRFAIDYRKLNSVTKPMNFPLPRLEDIFDTIGESKSKIFTLLDLTSGFWQLPLSSESKHKSAFVTHHGQYQWKRLPFGLSNATITFQETMCKVFQGMNWKMVLIYVDDFLILSQNFEQHLQHLKMVFERLDTANLKLSPAKCQFAVKEVKFLGHIVSKKGIQANPEKCEAIKNFPQPNNVKQLRSFIGLSNFYRKFIKDYSKKISPLNQLLKKGKKFVWCEKCQLAFDKVKQSLTSPPILKFPNIQKEFILTTDASSEAIGYILGQKDEQGNEAVISYGGRALRPAEKNYTISELECLAVIEGVK